MRTYAATTERTPPAWFVQELRLISGDLRVIWGREPYGVNLWTIERRYPPQYHAVMLESLRQSGKDRFVDQRLVDENDNIVGGRRYDRAPEWGHVHYVAVPGADMDSPSSYREPDRRDLQVIREWIFGANGRGSDTHDNPERQLKELSDERDRAEQAEDAERSYVRKQALKSPRFTDSRRFDMGDYTVRDFRRKSATADR